MKHHFALALMSVAVGVAQPSTLHSKCGIEVLTDKTLCLDKETTWLGAPIKTLSCPLTISIKAGSREAPLWIDIIRSRDKADDPDAQAEALFNENQPGQPMNLTEGYLSTYASFKGTSYKYGLIALGPVPGDYLQTRVAFFTDSGPGKLDSTFAGIVRYKCINRQIELVLQPPTGSVFIVHRPTEDGYGSLFEYGPPNEGLLSVPSTKDFYEIGEVYVTLHPELSNR